MSVKGGVVVFQWFPPPGHENRKIILDDIITRVQIKENELHGYAVDSQAVKSGCPQVFPLLEKEKKNCRVNVETSWVP